MRLNSLTKKSVILGTALSICACAVPTFCVLASGKKDCNNSNSKVQQTASEKEDTGNVYHVKSKNEDGTFELELLESREPLTIKTVK